MSTTAPQALAAERGRTSSSPARTLIAATLAFAGGALLVSSVAGATSLLVWANILRMPYQPYVLPEWIVPTLLSWAAGLVLVVAGMLLARGPLPARITGAVFAAAGAVATPFLVVGRAFGAYRIDVNLSGLTSPWFLVVVIAGIAWLVSRNARLGWITLLAAAPLAGAPLLLALNGVDGLTHITVMSVLSAVAGPVILLLGRSLRH